MILKGLLVAVAIVALMLTVLWAIGVRIVWADLAGGLVMVGIPWVIVLAWGVRKI